MFVVVISSSGQALLKDDGLYYNKQGKVYTGIGYEYYADSTIRSESTIVDGKLEGMTKIFFENGKLEEIRSFKKGMMHGKWEKWNKDQVRVAEANYKNNLKDGKWFVWDDKGTLRYDMTYEQGKKVGTWYMYDDKGKLTDKKSY
jgi:antitoxin component YwqK of YwqJK toxin-antitoxin module